MQVRTYQLPLPEDHRGTTFVDLPRGARVLSAKMGTFSEQITLTVLVNSEVGTPELVPVQQWFYVVKLEQDFSVSNRMDNLSFVLEVSNGLHTFYVFEVKE